MNGSKESAEDKVVFNLASTENGDEVPAESVSEQNDCVEGEVKVVEDVEGRGEEGHGEEGNDDDMDDTQGDSAPSYIDVDAIYCSDAEAGSPAIPAIEGSSASIPVKDDDNETENVEIKEQDDKNNDVNEFMKSLNLSGAPDSVELDIVRMPTPDVVTNELADTRTRRQVTIYPAKLTDMSYPGLQQLLRHESCIKFHAEYVRPPRTTTADWSGKLNFGFETMDAAVKAAEGVKNIRENLHVKVGAESIDRSNTQKIDNRSWMDALLIVKNIGEQVNTDELRKLFPSADILLRKQTKSVDNINGQAYVLYATAAQAESVLNEASTKRFELGSRKLLMFKYQPPNPSKLVPNGMLRLGERRLVLEELRDLKLKIEKYGSKSWLENKLNWYVDLETKDRTLRRQIGLTTPSFDQLLAVKNLRMFNEVEKKSILQRILGPYVVKEKKLEREKQIEDERVKSVGKPAAKVLDTSTDAKTASSQSPSGKSSDVKSLDSRSVGNVNKNSRAEEKKETNDKTAESKDGWKSLKTMQKDGKKNDVNKPNVIKQGGNYRQRGHKGEVSSNQQRKYGGRSGAVPMSLLGPTIIPPMLKNRNPHQGPSSLLGPPPGSSRMNRGMGLSPHGVPPAVFIQQQHQQQQQNAFHAPPPAMYAPPPQLLAPPMIAPQNLQHQIIQQQLQHQLLQQQAAQQQALQEQVQQQQRLAQQQQQPPPNLLDSFFGGSGGMNESSILGNYQGGSRGGAVRDLMDDAGPPRKISRFDDDSSSRRAAVVGRNQYGQDEDGVLGRGPADMSSDRRPGGSGGGGGGYHRSMDMKGGSGKGGGGGTLYMDKSGDLQPKRDDLRDTYARNSSGGGASSGGGMRSSVGVDVDRRSHVLDQRSQGIDGGYQRGDEWSSASRYGVGDLDGGGGDRSSLSTRRGDSGGDLGGLGSSASKADPVSLLLNLSQLLAEKMQRDREKDQEQKRGGY